MRQTAVATSFFGFSLLLGACVAPEDGDVEPLGLEEEGSDAADGIAPPATVLTAPQGPVAQVPGFGLDIARSGSDLELTWDDMGPGSTYTVWRSPTAGFVPGNSSATVVASGLTGTATTLAGLAGGADDFFRVRATNGGMALGDSTIAGEVNTEVFPGLNQMGVSLFPMDPDSDGFQGGLVDVSEVRSWNPGTQLWDTWLPWTGDPPIAIDHGESPWIGVIATQDHGLLGQVPAVNESNASLVAGWNTLTMPLSSMPTMASDVLAMQPAADSVAFWSGASQSWLRLWQAGWGADFQIEPGMGFWVDMTASGAWDPRICGDGVLDTDEICDDGNWADGDGCNASCSSDESCGNGIVDPAEACDDGNVVDGDGCSSTCAVELGSRYVFVSSAQFTGNMGGLAGADAECQALADAAGLPGTYMAWLGDGSQSPSTRFTPSNESYILPDGTVVANNWADLTNGDLAHPIDMTELMGPTPIGTTSCGGGGFPTVWSNVGQSGANAGIGHCNGWTDAGGTQAGWGNTSYSTSWWTTWCSGGGAVCGWLSPIYCFEQ